MSRALLGYDVLDVLRQAHRRSAGEPAIGTEHVLAALVDKAAVPAEVLRGVSEVGSTVDEPPVRAPAPEVVGVVREIAHRQRRAVVLSDAVEDALLDALRDAGEGDGDGPVLVTVEHFGRALLRLSGTRVAELLARNGFTAEQVRIGPVPVDKSALTLLAESNVLAGRDHPVKGALTNLFTRALGLGGSLLPLHLRALAGTQAVRGGRDATTAADLLLGVLALDELLHAHGEALKPELLPANDAGTVLRSCGADAHALRALVPSGRVFMGRPFLVTPAAPGEEEDVTRLSPAAERVMEAVRQRVSDGEQAGTRALVRELLDDEGGEVAKLLARQGADVERLRAELAGTRA
ncbi:MULTISPECIES: Clp protease N-terminal domain-containing protein [Actinosynnema]|uniref:Clp protease N-terminal domain-containing protein n=1 Tax=Actinosynnema TaxID=40566 RepID=UPI0020A36FEE|nr:Clp protease N-terminal domain-containing protein [Actinosynnema pretiosum]MCP2094530.1 Clp amino terminal domain-containing protein, pathogenicity island component [Actinosynnema pretiosum]